MYISCLCPVNMSVTPEISVQTLTLFIDTRALKQSGKTNNAIILN